MAEELLDEDEPGTLEEAARSELVSLWGDLELAVRSAINGTWSIRCDNIAYRIVTLSRFVGVTSWEEVSVALLEHGEYERVLREAGLEYPPIDWPRVAEVRRRIDAR